MLSVYENPPTCVDCGAMMIPCPVFNSRYPGRDTTYSGFYPCACGSRDPMGFEHVGAMIGPRSHPQARRDAEPSQEDDGGTA